MLSLCERRGRSLAEDNVRDILRTFETTANTARLARRKLSSTESMLSQLRSLLPAGLLTDAPEGSKPSGSEVDPDDKDKDEEINELKRVVRELQRQNSMELSQLGTSQPPQRTYLDTPVLEIFSERFPWLLSLMLFQSVSGWVIEHYEGLIERHVILAAFLTMLVGGGGNSSGQTVAELVKRLGRGELNPADLPQVLAKEVAVGTLLATGLAIGAYPRVRLLSSHATDLDALADPERRNASRAPHVFGWPPHL